MASKNDCLVPFCDWEKIVEYFNDVCDSFHTGISGAKCDFLTRKATRCKPSQNSLGVLYFRCETVVFGKTLTKEW